MNEFTNSLETAAARVQAGDERARREVREMLDPHMERIVRRALAKGNPSSPLVRKITAAARRLASDARSAGELAGLVAENLKQTVVNRLWDATEQPSLPAPTVV